MPRVYGPQRINYLPIFCSLPPSLIHIPLHTLESRTTTLAMPRTSRRRAQPLFERLSPELWFHIFAYTCTDGGYAGASLSAVSRHVRQLSAQQRYQSIAVCGIRQLYALVNMLVRVPPEMRKVKVLFFSEFPLRKGTQPGPNSRLTPEIIRMTGGPFSSMISADASGDSSWGTVNRDFAFQKLYFKFLEIISPTLVILHEYRRTSDLIPTDVGTKVFWKTRILLTFPVLKEYAVTHISLRGEPGLHSRGKFAFDFGFQHLESTIAGEDEMEAVDGILCGAAVPLDHGRHIRLNPPQFSGRSGYASDPGYKRNPLPDSESDSASNSGDESGPEAGLVPLYETDAGTHLRAQMTYLKSITSERWMDLCFPALECLHITQSKVDLRLLSMLPRSVKHVRLYNPYSYLREMTDIVEAEVRKSELQHWGQMRSSSPPLPTWPSRRRVYLSHPDPRDIRYRPVLEYLYSQASRHAWLKILGSKFVHEENEPGTGDEGRWEDGVRQAKKDWVKRMNGRVWWRI